MPNTPFMNMTIPVPGVTPGGLSTSSWGPMLSGAFSTVDAHDHSPGHGAPLTFTSGSFQVATDLGFGGHNLFSINNITMSGSLEASALTGSLTQIQSGSYSSGSWTGGAPYSGSFVPSGPFTYSTGTIAAFVGVGGIQVLTNSFGQVLISSSAGDDKYASYVLAAPDAENPNYRVITGSGDASIIDGGPGTTLTVSASIGGDRYASYLLASSSARNPNARTVAGQGGVSVIDGGVGSTLTISGSKPQISNLAGQGGVGVTNVGSLYTVSGSSPQISNLTGVGGSTVTNVGSLYQVSSSAPQVSNISGSGGIAVTNVGSLYSITDFDVFNDKGNTAYATASVSVDSQGRTVSQIGSDVYLWISGNIGLTGAGANKAVFGGDMYTSGTLTGSVAYFPATASNWNPQPSTVQQAIHQLAAANYSASLAPTQTALVIVSASCFLTKAKTGVVNLAGTMTVNPSTACSGTAQLFRDSTPIGPSMSLLMATQIPIAFSANWIDVLPDVSQHLYSFQVSASLGTLTVTTGSGALTVREIN